MKNNLTTKTLKLLSITLLCVLLLPIGCTYHESNPNNAEGYSNSYFYTINFND